MVHLGLGGHASITPCPHDTPRFGQAHCRPVCCTAATAAKRPQLPVQVQTCRGCIGRPRFAPCRALEGHRQHQQAGASAVPSPGDEKNNIDSEHPVIAGSESAPGSCESDSDTALTASLDTESDAESSSDYRSQAMTQSGMELGEASGAEQESSSHSTSPLAQSPSSGNASASSSRGASSSNGPIGQTTSSVGGAQPGSVDSPAVAAVSAVHGSVPDAAGSGSNADTGSAATSALASDSSKRAEAQSVTGSEPPSPNQPSHTGWESWEQYIEGVLSDGATAKQLKSELADAVKQEEYGLATALQARLAALKERDILGGVLEQLKDALAAEDYASAARLRDEGAASLAGWWAGTGEEDDAHGHILHITQQYGRWSGRAYSAREMVQLLQLREQQDSSGSSSASDEGRRAAAARRRRALGTSRGIDFGGGGAADAAAAMLPAAPTDLGGVTMELYLRSHGDSSDGPGSCARQAVAVVPTAAAPPSAAAGGSGAARRASGTTAGASTAAAQTVSSSSSSSKASLGSENSVADLLRLMKDKDNKGSSGTGSSSSSAGSPSTASSSSSSSTTVLPENSAPMRLLVVFRKDGTVRITAEESMANVAVRPVPRSSFNEAEAKQAMETLRELAGDSLAPPSPPSSSTSSAKSETVTPPSSPSASLASVDSAAEVDIEPPPPPPPPPSPPTPAKPTTPGWLAKLRAPFSNLLPKSSPATPPAAAASSASTSASVSSSAATDASSRSSGSAAASAGSSSKGAQDLDPGSQSAKATDKLQQDAESLSSLLEKLDREDPDWQRSSNDPASSSSRSDSGSSTAATTGSAESPEVLSSSEADAFDTEKEFGISGRSSGTGDSGSSSTSSSVRKGSPSDSPSGSSAESGSATGATNRGSIRRADIEEGQTVDVEVEPSSWDGDDAAAAAAVVQRRLPAELTFVNRDAFKLSWRDDSAAGSGLASGSAKPAAPAGSGSSRGGAASAASPVAAPSSAVAAAAAAAAAASPPLTAALIAAPGIDPDDIAAVAAAALAAFTAAAEAKRSAAAAAAGVPVPGFGVDVVLKGTDGSVSYAVSLKPGADVAGAAEMVSQMQELSSGKPAPRRELSLALTAFALRAAAGKLGPRATAIVEAQPTPSGSNTIKYSRIPVDAATRNDPFVGPYVGSFGPHGPELVQLSRGELGGEEAVFGNKLTGDSNVPAGQLAFRVKIGRKYRLSGRDVYPDELNIVARYKGEGRVAQPGFRSPKWVDGELLQFGTNSPLTGNAAIGFSWSVPGERRFLILLNKLDLQKLGTAVAE